MSFGLAGNDDLTSNFGSEFSILVGGSGDDVYRSRTSTTMTIADGGSSPGDTLVTSTLSPASNTVTALIDGRHFAAVNLDTDEAVYILDFLSPKNYIETIQTPAGTFSSIDLWEYARQQPSFLGNLSWEGLRDHGINHPYSTQDTNEAISFYEGRARALEVVLPPGEEDLVYRFYNTQTGAHFYTASVEERDLVARDLPHFRYEGGAFREAEPLANDGIPVYRFYNNDTGVHFYTANETERDSVIANLPQFRFEGQAYEAYAADGEGREELHRFYNTDTGTHFYTANDAEQAHVAATLPQYRYEGVGYYVDAA